MILSIRQATKADIDVVTEFDATDDKTVFEHKKGGSFISGLIEAESAYIAFVDTIPAGYARVDYLWPERVPLLSWLYIKEEFRDKGLADAMRDYVFNAVQAKDPAERLHRAPSYGGIIKIEIPDGWLINLFEWHC